MSISSIDVIPVSDADDEACGRNHSGQRRYRAAQKVEPAINHMMQHVNQPLPKSELISMTGVCSSSFYHLFKLATGWTPNHFFIRARMERACKLLQETKLSIKQVAAVMGYDDQFYFSRLFKCINGISPREYRRSLPPKPAGAGKTEAKTICSFGVRDSSNPSLNSRNILAGAVRF